MAVKKPTETHERPQSGDEVNPVQSETIDKATDTNDKATERALPASQGADEAAGRLVRNPKADPTLESVIIGEGEYKAGSSVTEAQYEEVAKHKDSSGKQFFLKRGVR